jgi:uncharacterized protein DUF4350
MPVSLDPADRRILILFGGLLLGVLAIGAFLFPSDSAKGPSFPTTRSSASEGAKAAYLLLTDLGYTVERWALPPAELPQPASDTLLILAEPLLPASAEEISALNRFVNSGGRVLAIGQEAAKMVPQGGLLKVEANEAEWKIYRAVAPSPLTRGADEILVAPGTRWEMKHFGHLAVYAEGSQAAVVTYRVGKGRIIWWAAATPLTNAGITLSGNLQLFLNSVGPARGVRVLWDEYYHGERGTLRSYLEKTPVPLAFAQLGVLALALLLTFARRSGPVRPPQVAARLSPLEFVETLGDLYHRGHAGAAAASISVQHFRALLTRRLGLPAGAPIAQLHQAARDRLGWTEPGFYEALQAAERATRQSDIGDEDALRVVQSLEHYAELLQIKRRANKETQEWPNR